ARLRRGEADARGNILIGRCQTLDAANALVLGDNAHLVAIIGLDDIIVVRTPDATLICPRHRAEDVKLLVEMLERHGLTQYL
ncbi:MAG: mannose-1-phosphate guanylyltransferase, partial [Planctomycetes bacterium]|nr:mannose-1-phosphate guanylyltransferase [Planctomycetota bacterium]